MSWRRSPGGPHGPDVRTRIELLASLEVVAVADLVVSIVPPAAALVLLDRACRRCRRGTSPGMDAGAWMMVVAMLATLATLGFLLFSLWRSIVVERTGERSVWREFGLGLSLMILFFVTWGAHAITQWQTYTDQQREHEQPVEMGDFFGEFGQSTLENWQSEFLQLFSFVVLAGLFIHRGSAESKDSEEKLEAAIRRIEEKLDTLPDDAPKARGERWKLPTPQ